MMTKKAVQLGILQQKSPQQGKGRVDGYQSIKIQFDVNSISLLSLTTGWVSVFSLPIGVHTLLLISRSV